MWSDLFALLRISNWSQSAIRAFSGSVAMLLIAAVVWQLVGVQTVSANELLDKAMAEQTAKINSVSEAVVYRKIRVGRSNAESFDWEVWRDATGGRYRQTLSGNPQNSLAGILSQNHMNPLEPLSPASFRAWRDSLGQREDEVSHAGSENGESLLALRTVNKAAQSVGEITRAVLKVREADWHPVYEELRVKTSVGEETYELTEVQFQVVSLSTLQPNFFGEDVKPQIATTKTPDASPSPAESSSPGADEAVNANVSAPPAATTATSDDEIEVLQLLNQAGADLGEQITVKRENGMLYVRGVVETAQRKNEILGALQQKANNPAIKIQIETNAEALARVAKQKSNSSTQEIVGADNQPSAAEDELVKRFGSAEAARSFSLQMVSRSRRALSRAYALKRLAGQFTTEELRQMKPEARAKWLALIRQHAGAFKTETESLRGELQNVFGASGGGASGIPAVSDWSDVPNAVEKLVELGSANDQIIRAAFAVSAGDVRFSAVKTPQFWQSLRNTEALAAKLQNIK